MTTFTPSGETWAAASASCRLTDAARRLPTNVRTVVFPMPGTLAGYSGGSEFAPRGRSARVNATLTLVIAKL